MQCNCSKLILESKLLEVSKRVQVDNHSNEEIALELKAIGGEKNPISINISKVCYSRIWHDIEMETFPLPSSIQLPLISTPSPIASRPPNSSCPKKGTEKIGQGMERQRIRKKCNKCSIRRFETHGETCKHMETHANWKHMESF